MSCTVYFNLDDTLTETNVEYEQIYREAVTEAGLEQLSDEYETYTKRFFDHFNNGWAFPRRQAIDTLARDHDCYDAEKIEAFAEKWEQREAAATTARDGAAAMLEDLSSRHQIGIMTNGTSALQRKKLEETGLAQYIDDVVVSGEEGYMKPERPLFEIAKDRLQADRYVMVSHRAKRDIVPAQKYGLTAVLYYQGDQELPDTLNHADSFDALVETIDDLCSR